MNLNTEVIFILFEIKSIFPHIPSPPCLPSYPITPTFPYLLVLPISPTSSSWPTLANPHIHPSQHTEVCSYPSFCLPRITLWPDAQSDKEAHSLLRVGQTW